MDCDLARLFLQFTRPEGDDLDAPEAAELQSHLEQCSACNSLAMNSRRLDQHLGRAMNAVPLPTGLKARLSERLTEERGVFRRRWVRRIGRVAALAACLMLVVWGGYTWYLAPERNRIDLAQLHYTANFGGSDPTTANRDLRQLGGRPGAPEFADFGHLAKGSPTLAILPGHDKRVVPQFIFAQQSRSVIMYVIPTPTKPDQIEGSPSRSPEYPYSVDTYDDGSGYTYLILYTGDSWEWVKKPE